MAEEHYLSLVEAQTTSAFRRRWLLLFTYNGEKVDKIKQHTTPVGA
jgi:hypothetical protein